jgi:protein-disulfide isomerase
VPQIEKEYVETGKLRYVVRDFPLESIHKNAFKAAEATRCAGEQGKYWEMHDQLFTHQQALSPQDLGGYAEAIGLNVQLFQACLESGNYAAAIRQDIVEGKQAGVTGTPAFFLGVTDGNDGKIKVRRTLKGAQAYDGFKAAIDSVLADQK